MTLHTNFQKLVAITSTTLLLACSPDPGSEPAITAPDTVSSNAVTDGNQSAPQPPPATPVAAETMNTADAANTVNALMNDTINPAARNLWTAVSYVVTEQGEQETSPQTDDDWNGLRGDAEALLQAAVRLQLPGLRVNADAGAARPDFQFTPAEIEAAMIANPLPWRDLAHDMETTTLQILGAIERRDLVQYLELGVELNEACEGCHAQYWYRPQPMRGAEGLR